MNEVELLLCYIKYKFVALSICTENEVSRYTYEVMGLLVSGHM